MSNDHAQRPHHDIVGLYGVAHFESIRRPRGRRTTRGPQCALSGKPLSLWFAPAFAASQVALLRDVR